VQASGGCAFIKFLFRRRSSDSKVHCAAAVKEIVSAMPSRG
jgi:hypothetical protein